MNKNKNNVNVWGEEESTPVVEIIETPPKKFVKPTPTNDFDLEGLKSDFPTAKELEQFVYDRTNVTLNLKGRANDLKYTIALAVLNGEEIDPKYMSGENPYVDKTELIPEDPLKPVPHRDDRLPPVNELQHIFHSRIVPHPDYDMRALDAKVTVCFRKYNNGVISYEIMGPIEKHAVGEKLDKWGRSRPEKIVWNDPRTGEQMLRDKDGTYTKRGQALKTLMESYKVNKNGTQWSVWIDKDFTIFRGDAIENPWTD